MKPWTCLVVQIVLDKLVCLLLFVEELHCFQTDFQTDPVISYLIAFFAS